MCWWRRLGGLDSSSSEELFLVVVSSLVGKIRGRHVIGFVFSPPRNGRS